MRVEQPEGSRGSLKWIQRAVETRPEVLALPDLGPINWVSPLRNDAFAEYRDGAFLRRLNLSWLENELTEFWPRRGPQWDALGLAGDKIVLVEAKARVPEFVSPACQASESSLLKITTSFDRVKDALGVESHFDWTQRYYQYANRIASVVAAALWRRRAFALRRFPQCERGSRALRPRNLAKRIHRSGLAVGATRKSSSLCLHASYLPRCGAA